MRPSEPTLVTRVSQPCCKGWKNRKDACAQSSRTFVTSSRESLARAALSDTARESDSSAVQRRVPPTILQCDVYHQAWATHSTKLRSARSCVHPCLKAELLPTARTPWSNFDPHVALYTPCLEQQECAANNGEGVIPSSHSFTLKDHSPLATTSDLKTPVAVSSLTLLQCFALPLRGIQKDRKVCPAARRN